jgi:urease accessory protein
MTAWHASLDLRYRLDRGRTVLAQSHRGPLQVQKALYPEGDAHCHTIVIHPPGGIAGGDALKIDVACEAGASALITTPGAAKWYKANGRRASQHIALHVQGALEWLPQEAILFDAADIDSSIHIDLAAGAVMLGWDIVALGRRAAGETFTAGCFAQSIRLSVDGELHWLERTRIAGGDALLDSPIGLDGRHVFGCLWAYGPEWTDDLLDNVRAQLADRVAGMPATVDAAPLTRLTPRLLVARTVASSTQAARRTLQAVWEILRPLVLQQDAIAPRIWAT